MQPNTIQSLADRPRSSGDRLRELVHNYAELLNDPIVVGLIRAVIADSQNSSAFRDRLDTHGNEILAHEFLIDITELLQRENPAEVTQAAQASIELRGSLEHITLLPQLLFQEIVDPENLRQRVDETLASWQKRWILPAT